MTRRHGIAAALATTALALAVLGRLTACPGCEYEILGVPLFAVGAAYDLALGLLALFAAPLRVIGWASLPAVTFHAGLSRFQVMLGAPCATCLASAVLIFALSLVCLWPERRWKLAPGAVAILGLATLPMWSGLLVETERVAGLPEFARAADLRDPPDRATLMVAYLKEGCSYCRAFENGYEPALAREFGPGLVVRRIDGKERRGLARFPSFVIRSPGGSYVIVRGLPRYEDLAARIRSALNP